MSAHVFNSPATAPFDNDLAIALATGLEFLNLKQIFIVEESKPAMRVTTRKNEERKLEEQKRRKLEHSARAPTPRRPEQQPWSRSSTARRGQQRLGVPSPPQGQVIQA
ncbi:hypothetical protein PIB30_068473 [Stylosanthes scabra]|uniref:RNase H type-1 domain-containing protein n=1 Tax=Stylosanthes scabra TaxID=79078 RepID=A0ABU6YL34_9FABA|nr:hypothetical protein [Stylosanthes scabra]